MKRNLFRSWNTSLTIRIAGTLFILVILGVSAISYVVYKQATDSLTQSVYERLNAVSILKEDDLTRWVDQQRLDLVFLAWQPEVQAQAGVLLRGQTSEPDVEAAYSTLLSYFQFVITSVSDSDELFIMDLNGQVVLSTLPDHEGYSHAGDEFFKNGLSSTYVQPVYTSPETGRPTISVATPLFDEARRRVGVLAGQLNLTRLDRIILERTGLGLTGETYLVNNTHEFVSSTRVPGTKDLPGKVYSNGIDAALLGNDGQALYTNYEDIPVVGVYNWLDDQGAALIVEISQAEAFEPARQLAIRIAEYGLLASLLLAGAAYVLARQIAKPVITITGAARAVAAGDLEHKAVVKSRDEVGLLAGAFNQMTDQLRVFYQDLEKKVVERTADLQQANSRLTEEIAARELAQVKLHHQKEYLEALYDTSLGLISRLDLQDLFQDLVSRAAALMGTPHGFIYIVEPAKGVIECKIGIGLFARLVGYQAPPGEGLGGKVWQTGNPLIIDDYDEWSGRAKVIDPGLIRSVIGVPLTSNNQVVGVLGMAYSCDASDDQVFSEPQVEQLNRFAALVSIALDNARLYTSAKEARAAAEAANNAKSIFLANVSHELRTPLTSIVGFTQLLKKRLREYIYPHIPPQDTKAQRAAAQAEENLNIITSEGERLTNLINNLLDHEKIRAGKLTWHYAPLRIKDVITKAASASYSLFENKGLTWKEEVASDLPLVNGDRDRLEQVMINLISNAVKFSDAGQVTCRAVDAGDEIIVSIQDQGIGIAPEDQALVFEQFAQVEDTLTGKPRGTGLGLPISKEIISHHGGRIWLESSLGQGSTFYFSLPVSKQISGLPASGVNAVQES